MRNVTDLKETGRYCVICLTGKIPDKQTSRIKYAATAKSLQSCLTLYNPMDGSSPGSPIPGILQARTLDWVAIAFPNA